MKLFAKSNFVEFEQNTETIITLEEIMNMKNKTMKFDYIISNPPYNIGNAITKSVIDNVNFDNFINLMPLSKYKSRDLYKNVKSLELADGEAFDDITLTDNLCICELVKKTIDNQTYDDLSLISYKKELREFYNLNEKYKLTYEILPNMLNKYDIIENKNNFNVDTDFLITTRTVQNGVHKTADCWDYKFNIERQLVSALSYMIRLNNKTNLCRFWYNNPLMNDLIKGLNKRSGSPLAAIPNIDYSIDRDYEHLTLDDIMKILREENSL